VIYVAADGYSQGQPASLADLESYTTKHGIGYPLLADPNWAVCQNYESDWGIPSFHVLTPGPTWHTFDGVISEGTFVPLLDQY